MAKTFAALVTEVQTRLGEENASAGDLIGSTRVGVFVNQAIRDIIRANPGLRDVNTLDKTTWHCATNKYEYDLNDFQEKPVAHVVSLRYVDPSNTNYYRIKPYPEGIESFDMRYPYIPDLGTNIPEYYIRRGNMLELAPMPGTNENGAMLWLEYSYIPDDISGSTYPALTDFDEAIIYYSWAYCLDAMDQPQKAQAKRALGEFWAVKRVDSEKDFDTVDQIADWGP